LKELVTRAVTGILFTAILVGAICFHQYSFLVLFSLITALTLWEFYGLMKIKTLKRIFLSIGGSYLFVATFLFTHALTEKTIFIPYILFCLSIPILELYNKKSTNPTQYWAIALLGQLYGAGSFSLLNALTIPILGQTGTYTPVFTLSLFIFIWSSDTGAYIFGSLLGKHKLFERISPNKTWEGFIGGLFTAAIASLIMAYFYTDISYLYYLGMALTVVIFGTWGDLIESFIKRTLQVKDSGKILPGHGGMLDRFDSMILAIPAVYIFMELFLR